MVSMSSMQLQLALALAALVCLCAASGLDPYFDADNSESHECSLGEDNRLPYPYALHGAGKLPSLGGDTCGDCGFVIVEKRHHYCIPGKSVIKVLRRKPSCNCKNPTAGRRDYYGAESKVVPSYVSSGGVPGPSPVAEALPSSDQVSRMLRTLISERAGHSGDSEKAAATSAQYRALESGNVPRTYN